MSDNLYRDINLRDQTIKAALKVIEVLQTEVHDEDEANKLMAEGESAFADLELLKLELGYE